VPGEDYSDCVVADAVDYSAATGLLSQKPQRPPCSSLRWWPADHRDDGRLLAAVQLGCGLWSGVFSERVLQASVQVPLSDPRYLAWVAADRDCRRAYRLARVEQQKHLNPPPDTRRQRRPAASLSL